MNKVAPQRVRVLESAVSKNLLIEDVPEEIIANHHGISPLAMRDMLQYFEEYETSGENKELENLLVPYATDTDAVGKFVAIFTRLFNRLTNEFGNYPKYVFQEALITVHWMQGRPIKRIIEERQKKLLNETVHESIRKVLDMIETVARYKAPKYVSCYNDLLRHYFLSVGRNDLANEIEDITLFLEMGVNTKTHLSLMNLGLSRTSSIEIKEYITLDDFSERDCIEWLTNQKNDWRSNELPVLVVKEIDKMLKIHVA